MASFTGLGASGGVAVAAVVVVAVGAAGYFALRSDPNVDGPAVSGAVQPAPEPKDAEPVLAVEPAETPAPDETAPPEIMTAEPALLPTATPSSPTEATPAEEQAADPSPTAAPAPVLPSFDVVRIEPDGNGLIAGRAESGSDVAALLDGVEIGQADADAGGGFVILATIAPAEMPRLLALRATLNNVVYLSEQTVIVAPQATPKVALVQPDDTTDAPIGDVIAALQDAPDVSLGSDKPVAPATDTAPAQADGQDAAPMPTTLTPVAPEPIETPTIDTENAVALPGQGDGVSDERPTPPAFAAPDAVSAPPQQIAALEEPAASVLPNGTPSPLDDGPTPRGEAVRPTLPDAEISGINPAPPDPVVVLPPQVLQTDVLSDAPAMPEAPSTTQAPTAPSQRAEAPRVLVADDRGLRVIQDPGPSPVVQQSVSIDTISYDAEGEVVLAGRGKPASGVRIYLDNVPIQSAPIGPDGQWRIDLPDIETRVYTLRVDEIEADGKVRSRAETPFRPEPADVVAAQLAEADPDAPLAVVTVQPGFTLWRIARENYGEGILYVRVFEANAEKIRDPDLIYPGQIFDVPK